MLPFRCLTICALVLGFSGSALGQERPALEIAGGYQYVRELFPDEFAENVSEYPKGLFVAAGWNVANRFTVVGEFSLSAEVIPVNNSTGAFEGFWRFGDIDSTVYTSLVGARYWFGRLFVQGLFGQVAVQTKQELLSGTLDETLTDLMVQPGAGYDVAVTSRVSVRIHGDYRQVLSDENRFKRQFRIAVGVAVGLGPLR